VTRVGGPADIPTVLRTLDGDRMTSKISIKAAIALAALLAIQSASYGASNRHRGAPPNETTTGYSYPGGYDNPFGCLGGACTGVNPDRVRQPCSGGSCYKRSHTIRHRSSSLIFDRLRAS
jgi:hypothetical protein